MNTEKLYHYTYIITNVVENKYYIGCRSSKVLPEKDLGTKYFSSSRDKEFLKDQKLNPQNYKYKVIAEFSSRALAVDLEIKLHNIHNVAVNPKFYNRSKQTSVGWDTAGTSLSPEHKEASVKKLKEWLSVPENKAKFVASLKGRVISEETRAKIAKANKGNVPHNKGGTSHMKGKTHTEATKEKMTKARKGKKPSQNTIEGAKKAFTKFANIYKYGSNEMIAENVSTRVFAETYGYSARSLRATATSDRLKPSSSKNPLHHKGIYAQYI